MLTQAQFFEQNRLWSWANELVLSRKRFQITKNDFRRQKQVKMILNKKFNVLSDYE